MIGNTQVTIEALVMVLLDLCMAFLVSAYRRVGRMCMSLFGLVTKVNNNTQNKYYQSYSSTNSTNCLEYISVTFVHKEQLTDANFPTSLMLSA